MVEDLGAPARAPSGLFDTFLNTCLLFYKSMGDLTSLQAPLPRSLLCQGSKVFSTPFLPHPGQVLTFYPGFSGSCSSNLKGGSSKDETETESDTSYPLPPPRAVSAEASCVPSPLRP